VVNPAFSLERGFHFRHEFHVAWISSDITKKGIGFQRGEASVTLPVCAVELVVLGFAYYTHASLAKLFKYSIMGNCLTDHFEGAQFIKSGN